MLRETCQRQPRGGGRPVRGAALVHFDGGADMVLPVANYYVDVDDGAVCWIVQRSPSVSIIGNIMQMNYHVRHYVKKSFCRSSRPTAIASDGITESSAHSTIFFVPKGSARYESKIYQHSSRLGEKKCNPGP